MLLSIISINRNNAIGLKKTMDSVWHQNVSDFEYIVVDGASTDGSVDVIKCFAARFGPRLRWVSESDTGIYQAMNKGIEMATGQYVEFLNSGDCLASEVVIESITSTLEQMNYPSILYGNVLKAMEDGRQLKDECFAGQDITFLGFFFGTLNHSSSFIKKSLFEVFGFYDESLKIVADWKWFMQAIIFGGEKPVYADIDVTIFDMTGISETNKDLCREEREKILDELIPSAILADYREWGFPILKMKRLRRHPWAYKLVEFLERCLFKWEKLCNLRTRVYRWR